MSTSSNLHYLFLRRQLFDFCNNFFFKFWFKKIFLTRKTFDFLFLIETPFSFYFNSKREKKKSLRTFLRGEKSQKSFLSKSFIVAGRLQKLVYMTLQQDSFEEGESPKKESSFWIKEKVVTFLT